MMTRFYPILFSLMAFGAPASSAAGVHYQTGDRMLGSQSGVKTKGRDYYQISAGWGNGSWNIYVGASNIFSRGWKETEQEYAGNLYSYTATSYGIRRHANIFVGASYTFGYGRKVDRSNEAAEQSGGKSAVINL